MFAGSDTVGNATTVGTFYILENKQIHAALTQELEKVWPDTDSKVGYEVLEKLPYLVGDPTTCLKEGS
jgi:cytochrome P450